MRSHKDQNANNEFTTERRTREMRYTSRVTEAIARNASAAPGSTVEKAESNTTYWQPHKHTQQISEPVTSQTQHTLFVAIVTVRPATRFNPVVVAPRCVPEAGAPLASPARVMTPSPPRPPRCRAPAGRRRRHHTTTATATASRQMASNRHSRFHTRQDGVRAQCTRRCRKFMRRPRTLLRALCCETRD